MGLIRTLFEKLKDRSGEYSAGEAEYHEFCPRCEADLTMQKGYRNDLPYWICKGCGEMLINPEVDAEDDISWFCDGCGNMLNIQEGFAGNDGEWVCRECGYRNKIDPSEVYLSEDEYESHLKDPYRGLSDADMLAISAYEEERTMGGRSDVIIVRDPEDGRRYVKKILADYNLSVYQYLLEHPVAHMPRLVGLYEGSSCLIVIEEYIEGRTLAEVLEDGCLGQSAAVDVAVRICRILEELHGGGRAIIHRDIKPSNIILADDGEVYLLDMNVAKWCQPEESEDTKLYGTLYYAAPEQFGYGFSASSEKTDVYAVGILLNVMITGKLPKQEKAQGAVWDVIERCICLEPERRASVVGLVAMLERIGNQ